MPFSSPTSSSFLSPAGRMASLATALTFLASPGFAQVPDAAPPAAPAPAASPSSGSQTPGATPNSTFLGKDVMMFDPGSESFLWDGKTWNINNNRVFQARFEKYLNAPEETSKADREYQAVINEVLTRLAPGNATRENVDYAFKLLTRGSDFDTDARLCDSLADAVYTVWMAQRQQQRLSLANRTMQFQVMQLEAQTRLSGTATQAAKDSQEKTKGKRRPGGRGGQAPPETSAEEEAADTNKAALETAGWKQRRLAELVARQQG
ncbi:MAG: hypothetical protein ABI680_15240, partial [Chthoniobacteraceae bacterium]